MLSPASIKYVDIGKILVIRYKCNITETSVLLCFIDGTLGW